MISKFLSGKLNVFILGVAATFLIISIICLYLAMDTNKSIAKKVSKNNISLVNNDKSIKRQLDKLTQEISELKQKNAELEKEKQEKERERITKDPGTRTFNNTENSLTGIQNLNNSIPNAIEKVAYLTFDDGPSVNTGRILKILKDNDIKATFFVNGNENMLETYRSILADGHAIGNHTYSHDYRKVYTSVYDFISDFNKLNMLLEKIDGYKVEIFRFPGGSKNNVSKKYGGTGIMDKIKTAMKEKGFTYFDWNVTSADTDPGPLGKVPEVLTNNVLKGAKNKKTAIVLMHDRADRDATVEALPGIIAGLKEQGFEFKALSKDVKY